jgi:hypothetical protein
MVVNELAVLLNVYYLKNKAMNGQVPLKIHTYTYTHKYIKWEKMLMEGWEGGSTQREQRISTLPLPSKKIII